MAKKFKEPIEPTQKRDGTYPWSFAAPTKDQATSGHLSAGDHYGIGFRTPVGKEKPSSISSGPIPFGRHTATCEEVINGEA
jgi:hypothetical protein